MSLNDKQQYINMFSGKRGDGLDQSTWRLLEITVKIFISNEFYTRENSSDFPISVVN